MDPPPAFGRIDDAGLRRADDHHRAHIDLRGIDLGQSTSGVECIVGVLNRVDLTVRNLFDIECRDFLDTYKGYALSPGRDIRVSLSVPFGG
jgi:hypothetical protein